MGCGGGKIWKKVKGYLGGKDCELHEGLNSLSMSEVRQMLRDVAWREAMDSWKEEARSHSKLAEVQKLIEKGYEARCVEVKLSGGGGFWYN